MSYLLLVGLGPVQDFIAQARRTRDLWFGSHLLSELSRACAKSLTESRATLIFPALCRGHPELCECDEPVRGTTGKPPRAIANKILAETDGDPAEQARTARCEVKKRWCRISGGVRSGCHAILSKSANINDVWHEQIDEVLEFYAVWVPRTSCYKKDRNDLEQALEGRKRLRDFRQFQHHLPWAQKSSLDGARVSVLGTPPDRDLARLGVRRGEQLDAIGVVKRCGFKPDRFIPLVNVAAGAWLDRASCDAKDELDIAGTACRGKLAEIDRELSVLKPFKFDASILYPSRWWPVFKERARDQEAPSNERIDTRDKALAWGKCHIHPLLEKMESEPPSYVACLRADGDHMGPAIDTLSNPDAHREFSAALAGFPEKARTIVEEDHLGSLVYAGGDDVLALLPVARVTACAEALRQAFCVIMQGAPFKDDQPTLSVGIGIQHVMDPMSALMELAREAERMAKDNERNSLAIIVDKRSGGRTQFVSSWGLDPMKRMQDDVDLLNRDLSAGKIYELRALLRRFPKPGSFGLDASVFAPSFFAFATDVLRQTGEKRPDLSLDRLGIEATDHYPTLHKNAAKALDRLLIVRELRRAGF